MITKVHHICLKAKGIKQFNKTIDFYSDILGFAIVRTWGEGKNSASMLKCGESLFEIFANGKNSRKEGAIRHIALATADVDAVIEKIKNAGYKVTVEPKDIVISSEPPFPARIAFCIGPVGETIEFFCEK